MTDRNAAAPADGADLCAHLRPLLSGEIAVGNRVRYRETGPLRPDAVVVMLDAPFSIDYTIRRPVIYERLNDPHWWGAEYRCAEHGHQLLCPVK